MIREKTKFSTGLLLLPLIDRDENFFHQRLDYNSLVCGLDSPLSDNLLHSRS